MNSLIEILKKETISLKEQYIEMTKEWSKNRFNVVVKRTDWNEEKWANFLGIDTRIVNEGTQSEFVSFHKGFFNTKVSRKFDSMRSESFTLKRIGIDGYVKKEMKRAENHYETSIIKLADRIKKKELNENKLEVKTSHIGVNIDTVLSDGVKQVKAFTIIASGEVQRPHYRYLINSNTTEQIP